MRLVFHPLVQRDLRDALTFYEQTGGVQLADRFWTDVVRHVGMIEKFPLSFHPVGSDVRRINLGTFPYHFLFRVVGSDVRVLVLRHHSRHPRFGTARI
jgi:toxin ParE1/3/4